MILEVPHLLPASEGRLEFSLRLNYILKILRIQRILNFKNCSRWRFQKKSIYVRCVQETVIDVLEVFSQLSTLTTPAAQTQAHHQNARSPAPPVPPHPLTLSNSPPRGDQSQAGSPVWGRGALWARICGHMVAAHYGPCTPPAVTAVTPPALNTHGV